LGEPSADGELVDVQLDGVRGRERPTHQARGQDQGKPVLFVRLSRGAPVSGDSVLKPGLGRSGDVQVHARAPAQKGADAAKL
jgi:hypothetical protein